MYTMKIVIALYSTFLKIIIAENVALSEENLIDSDIEIDDKDYHLTDPPVEEPRQRDQTFHDVIRLITSGEIENESEETNGEASDKHLTAKEPCSVLVISNIQTPSKQSLLRKYRYDAKGALIPSSVKYFIKLPQPTGSAPILVPLSEKSFTHLGGFVRIYKEVPPIPQEVK